MSGLVFLSLVLVLSLVGSLALWLWFREPRAWDSQMHEFNRTLDALSPGPPPARRRQTASEARGRRRPVAR